MAHPSKGKPINFDSTSMTVAMSRVFDCASFTKNTSIKSFSMRPFSWFRPTFIKVDSAMLSSANQLKVFKSVIQPVVIKMVNMFISLKSSSKMLFHNKSMFKNVSLLNLKSSIALSSNCAKSFLSSFRDIRITPTLQLSVVRTTHSFCINYGITVLNRAISCWKNPTFVVTNWITVLLSFVTVLKNFGAMFALNNNHGVNVS